MESPDEPALLDTFALRRRVLLTGVVTLSLFLGYGYLLAALEAVDAVVVFTEDTPLELIRHLRPDVLVKGGDYSADTIVGAADVAAWGGRVVIVPLRPGHSTTSTIARLRGDS